MNFPPFQILQTVRSLHRHAVRAPADYGTVNFNVPTGERGYIGYYWNDGWRFQVTWDMMEESPVTYPFSAWGVAVGPVPAAGAPDLGKTASDIKPMYAQP